MPSSPSIESPKSTPLKKASDLWSTDDVDEELVTSSNSVKKSMSRTRTVLFKQPSSSTKITPLSEPWEGRVRTILNSVTENKEKIAQLEEFIKASMEEIKLLLINQQNSVKQ